MSVDQPHRIAFFSNQTGGFYSASTIDHWFGQLLAVAVPDAAPGSGSPPRVYDLRHAHVVETINRWTRTGKDPEALLAYLSMHLGHTDPEDTWYYFHLAADFHPDLRAVANSAIESTLPEACHGVG
jgi:hypothetical protein